MAKRKKKNKNNGSLKTLMLFIVVGIAVWAWHEYQLSARQHSQPQHTEQPQANQPQIDSQKSEQQQADKQNDSEKKQKRQKSSSKAGNIEYVKIPADVKSQMLNYPGFTVSFNPEYHQPNFVVWELTGDESKSTVVSRRSDNFLPDLNVEGCPTLDDYRNSGFDRGHMAPAGDMKWSYDAMNACFLLTNMSPQRHALNSGAWKTLEDKCRDWAVRDSAIVIICGPVLTDELTRYIGDTKVAVPERYFKVLLAPYTDPPRGIGFIMANSNTNMGLQSTAVSIDEVEEVTGFDFFSSLPDKIEKQVEAECNLAKWNFKKRK